MGASGPEAPYHGTFTSGWRRSPHDTETSRAGTRLVAVQEGAASKQHGPCHGDTGVTRGRRFDSQACKYLATWLGTVTVRPSEHPLALGSELGPSMN